MSEDAIKEYARIRYLKGVKPSDIIADINSQWDKKYTLKAFQAWKVKGEWDENLNQKQALIKQNEKTLQKLPTFDEIKNKELGEQIELKEYLMSQIRQDANEGKKPNVALYNMADKISNSIISVSGKVVVGANNSLTNITINYLKDNKEMIDADIIK